MKHLINPQHNAYRCGNGCSISWGVSVRRFAKTPMRKWWQACWLNSTFFSPFSREMCWLDAEWEGVIAPGHTEHGRNFAREGCYSPVKRGRRGRSLTFWYSPKCTLVLKRRMGESELARAECKRIIHLSSLHSSRVRNRPFVFLLAFFFFQKRFVFPVWVAVLVAALSPRNSTVKLSEWLSSFSLNSQWPSVNSPWPVYIEESRIYRSIMREELSSHGTNWFIRSENPSILRRKMYFGDKIFFHHWYFVTIVEILCCTYKIVIFE